jgi:PAS domain S-box-containing protein
VDGGDGLSEQHGNSPAAMPVGVSRFPGAASPMHALFETHDWSASPLGPPESWPQSLKTTVGLMLPAMAQIVLFWGPDYVALYNDAYAPTIGDKHPHVLGRPACEGWSELWDDLEPLLASVRETGETVHAKDRPFHINRFGYDETVWFDISYSAVPDESGQVGGVLCIVSETTERVLAEEATRESEARYRGVFQNAGVGMIEIDADWNILSSNATYCQITGRPEGELRGASCLSFTHPEDVGAGAQALKSLASGEIDQISFEKRYLRPDGSEIWVRSNLSLVSDGIRTNRFLKVVEDITDVREAREELRELNQSLETRIAAAIAEREQAEEALRQSQKMEAVGQLTGGIAHDFNNLLTIITGNVDAARRHIGEDGPPRVQRALGNALVGAERAAVLTQRLLAFSRRQPLNPRPIDPNKLVNSMSELLHRTLGETIAVETVLAAGLWKVDADPHQLENAILNLAVNARDAMQDGGKLTIETANTHIDRDYATQNAGALPGQYVVICVSDTGTGMDADALNRAFEPFFTTKEVGKGTGLGLSMVYGFVKQSGGHVKIYSEEGHGTTVRIYLPRLLGEEAEEEVRVDAPVPEGTRDETILVCEDDDDVRAYTVEMLRELGYRVLEAHDGASALRLLERQEGRVDLLFTDVVLPGGMTGAIVAQEARKLRPELKVLFTTGYARNAIVHHGRLDPGVELLTKPFAYADLAARVRDMLDRR